MTNFRRGIRNPAFLDALGELAAKDGWWREVVRDPSLIIGIRDEYLNVYWQGQSLFKVGFVRGEVKATTHPKYLLNPDLSGQVAFDIEAGAFAPLKEGAILRIWEPGVTLSRMKSAASLFSGDEKIGVQKIANNHPDTIDVEIAFPAGVAAAASNSSGRSVPRLDLALVEKKASECRLVFWEAKLFANPELRDKKTVVQQIEDYRKILSDARNRSAIVESYQIIAENLLEITSSSEGARIIGPVLTEVAQGAPLILPEVPEINLVVFDYDAAQRDTVWRHLKKDLEGRLEPSRVIGCGASKDIHLSDKAQKV